jgi:hypothetical protein
MSHLTVARVFPPAVVVLLTASLFLPALILLWLGG